MHFWRTWEMLRLYNCLLITVNALDRRLMRRASATSSGRVPSIKNRRNGFVQARPSSVVGSVDSTAWLMLPSDGLIAASCASSMVSSSTSALGAAAFILMDLLLMLSRKTPGGTGSRVEPMFASSSASVLFALEI